MARTLQEILDHADELARVFEDHDPSLENIKLTGPLRQVAAAFRTVAAAEETLTTAVADARRQGHTWTEIGNTVGTSAEAARQRYGKAS